MEDIEQVAIKYNEFMGRYINDYNDELMKTCLIEEPKIVSFTKKLINNGVKLNINNIVDINGIVLYVSEKPSIKGKVPHIEKYITGFEPNIFSNVSFNDAIISVSVSFGFVTDISLIILHIFSHV